MFSKVLTIYELSFNQRENWLKDVFSKIIVLDFQFHSDYMSYYFKNKTIWILDLIASCLFPSEYFCLWLEGVRLFI